MWWSLCEETSPSRSCGGPCVNALPILDLYGGPCGKVPLLLDPVVVSLGSYIFYWIIWWSNCAKVTLLLNPIVVPLFLDYVMIKLCKGNSSIGSYGVPSLIELYGSPCGKVPLPIGTSSGPCAKIPLIWKLTVVPLPNWNLWWSMCEDSSPMEIYSGTSPQLEHGFSLRKGTGNQWDPLMFHRLDRLPMGSFLS